MKKFNKLAWGISATALFLTACSSDAEAVHSSTETISQQLHELQNEFVSLQEEENNLQTLFVETLENDEEFTSIEDGSSELFVNIETRSEIINNINEIQSTLETEYSNMDEMESDELPDDQLNEVKTLLNESANTLNQFTASYSESLNQQVAYFETLVSDEANYDTFTDGIHSINETQASNYTLLSELDDALSSLSTSIQELQQTLNEQLSD